MLQEEILKNLASLMDSSRTQFPRLYFLSNQELVELLSISRNPQGFLPFAQRCFPGIVGLNYVLPSEICRGTMDGGLLDFHLNGQCEALKWSSCLRHMVIDMLY